MVLAILVIAVLPLLALLTLLELCNPCRKCASFEARLHQDAVDEPAISKLSPSICKAVGAFFRSHVILLQSAAGIIRPVADHTIATHAWYNGCSIFGSERLDRILRKVDEVVSRWFEMRCGSITSGVHLD